MKVKLHDSWGHAEFNEKRQGIFISHKKGIYKDIPYHKARLTQVFQPKPPKTIKKGQLSITMQKPYRFISFDVDMLKNVAELLGEIHKEIFGEPLYGGEIKEVKPAEPKTESDEVDELLAQLAQMKGRK